MKLSFQVHLRKRPVLEEIPGSACDRTFRVGHREDETVDGLEHSVAAAVVACGMRTTAAGRDLRLAWTTACMYGSLISLASQMWNFGRTIHLTR